MTTLNAPVRAHVEHAEAICRLLNLCYRGDVGWTNEHSLVDGIRTTVEDVQTVLSQDHQHFLIWLDEGKLLACVCLSEAENHAEFGTFAVQPELQNQGLGKQIMDYSEQYAKNTLAKTAMQMWVLSPRTELMAFYERRGYTHVNEIKAFPAHLNVGTPKVSNLTMQMMTKAL